MTLTEAKRAIKLLYDRTGKSELSFQQLELAASMALRWFTPTKAKLLIELAQKLDLLTPTNGDGLILNFDPDEITVPVGFKPHEDLIERMELKLDEKCGSEAEIFEPELEDPEHPGEPAGCGDDVPGQPPDELFMKIITKIAAAEELDMTDVISSVNKKQRVLDLEIEVLALLIAGERGIDITEFFDATEQQMAKRVRVQF